MSATVSLNHERFQQVSHLVSSSNQTAEQDRKFNTILAALALAYLIVAIAVPLIERIEVSREVKEQIPAQLAKIVLKERQLPLPEPIKEKPLPIDEPIEELKEIPEPVKEDKPAPEPVKQERTKREQAKIKAQSAGLAAMKDELFALREVVNIKPSATLAKSDTQATQVKRKLLAAEVDKQSAGLRVAKTSKTVSSDALSTRNTQKIRLSAEEVLANADSTTVTDSEGDYNDQRSENSLRRTLEANKARLYSLYNRALRKDPFLKGKVLFEITILPNGNISQVIIKSSELNNKKLERQLILVLRAIKFPVQDVAIMTTIWAIDFLPN